VQAEVADITARLADLRAQVASLDKQLQGVAIEIIAQTDELHTRESLLQDHMRSAYERSQTSVLELLLSADSLDAATNQVSYMITVSDQDKQLAIEIRDLRASLETKEESLRAGRLEVAAARDQANAEAKALAQREAELATMQAELARLQSAADQKRAEQEAALNAALQAKGNVAQQIADSQKAFDAQTKLVAKLQAEEDARRQAPSAFGFKWPELTFQVTQEWGPTGFVLRAVVHLQRHLLLALPRRDRHRQRLRDAHPGCRPTGRSGHPGSRCGRGIRGTGWSSATAPASRAGTGTCVAQVIVSPGQVVSRGQVIGYEGNTGNSTGCHLHFAINDHGIWENPRVYLP